jgi:glucosyl-3-phosphoglycerate synthase
MMTESGLSTSSWADWAPTALLDARGSLRIAVVIPARDEERTIGRIVGGIRAQLVDSVPLVDDVVVIDSDSSDRTAAEAEAHGARVFASRSIRPDLGTFPGKGEALWKSQFVTDADLLVFIDADLTGWGPHFVSGLVGPLLSDQQLVLAKGFYDRLTDDNVSHAPQGGRVTELVARPLLNMWWPALAHVVQPLAGEWAIRRSTFSELNVPVGYGVELAVLLDVYRRAGLGAIAQVDLGERAHAHQSVHDLGRMAAEILTVAARRAGWAEPASDVLWQFDRSKRPPWVGRAVPTAERPPAASVGLGPS